MKLFYFSATGNSLHAARRLAALAGGGELVPIASLPRSGPIAAADDVVGFCYPAVCHGSPRIVLDLARRLVLKGRPYVFGLVTHNGGPGSANRDLARALRRSGVARGRAGVPLAAGFELLMPGNSVILRDFTNPEAERARRLDAAEAELAAIAGMLRGRTSTPPKAAEPLKDRLEGAMTAAALRLYRLPRRFRADQGCTRCGTCAAVCPRENVRVAGAVEWGKDCLNCLACFHWCPSRSVQIGAYTAASLRYHHPAVKARDIAAGGGRANPMD